MKEIKRRNDCDKEKYWMESVDTTKCSILGP